MLHITIEDWDALSNNDVWATYLSRCRHFKASRDYTAGFLFRAQQGQATRAATGELACAARSS